MYAEELSKRTNIQAISFEEIKDINKYDKIILVTVGLADPKDNENTNNIKNSIKKQLTKETLDRTIIFHLRGGIDYSKLNFAHKTMMGLLYKKAKNLPEEKKTAEVKAMIDIYNKKVDFVDFSSLESIISEIKK